MKKIIQIMLIIILIFISYIFYKIYFNKKKILATDTPINQSSKELDQSSKEIDGNIIKNLKYEVKLEQNNEYTINAKWSKIHNKNNIEYVNMNDVTAIFVGENNKPLKISSDEAVYNSYNYETNFTKNVQIEYIGNIIYSEKLDLNFENNVALIYDNVRYNGTQGTMKTDNVKINLMTKKIDIYMNNINENIKGITK
jgi:hypothetical protein